MYKVVTVTFTSIRQLPKTRTAIDILFEYKYVDSKFVGEPEEVSNTFEGSIFTSLSDTLVAVWELGDTENLKKVLFEYARRHLIAKVGNDALRHEEEIKLNSYNSPPKCPYDPARIKYLLNVPIKLTIQLTKNLSHKENEELPVFPDITPSSITESKHYEFIRGDFQSKADIENLINLMFNEGECSYCYFAEKGKGIIDVALKEAKDNGTIIMNEIEFFYYKHPSEARGFVKIEVRDGKYEREWEKNVVENSPMFMRIKLELSERKRTEMETLLKISIEEARRNKRKLDRNHDTSTSHNQKNVPENFFQTYMHFIWPPDRLWKKAILISIPLVIIGYFLFSVLPEKYKSSLIDTLFVNRNNIADNTEKYMNKTRSITQNTIKSSAYPKKKRMKTNEPITTNKTISGSLFKTKIFISADGQGRIHITGGEGITHLTQFCPEEWRSRCQNDINIERTGNVFELDRTGLLTHQTAFNFRNARGDWLLIPDRQQVTFGDNVEIDIRPGGSYFFYTGSISY